MRIFHLLSEHDLFSEPNGGAISRWVANVARADERNIVVTSETDDTWDIPAERVLLLPLLKKYRWIRNHFGSRRFWPVRKRLLRGYFGPLFESIQAGDVMWIHNRPETAAAMAPILRKKGARLVLHMHNSHLRYATAPMLKELHDVQFVFVSEFLRKEAAGFSSAYARATANGVVLYNGADASLFRPPEEPVQPDQAAASQPGDAVRILFVGRLVPDKGAHVLAAALKRLAARGLPVTGVIVGAGEFKNGSDSAYVRSLKADAAPNTEFRGHLSGQPLIQEFQKANVFCVPSVWNDPFPLTPLEAMASGLPVIASRSGGVPEALQYGGGVIFERDSVEGLEAAIETFLNNPALRQETAAKALDSFEKHFTWSIVCREFGAIVDRVSLKN